MNQIEKLESMSEENAREELIRICHGTPDREIAAQWGVQEYEVKRLRGKYGIKKDTSGSIVYNASVKKFPWSIIHLHSRLKSMETLRVTWHWEK